MKEFLRYLAHKYLEILLLGIVAGLLYVTHVPVESWAYALVPIGLFLAVYEYESIRMFPYRFALLARRHRLEILLFVIIAVLAGFWNPDIELGGAIFIAYFVLVFFINSEFLQRGIARGFDDARRDVLSLALLGILFTLLVIWEFKAESIFFLLAFVAFLLYQWDSRVLAAGALLSLAACPFLLIAGEDSLAEQMAVWAYYFLVMTVVLQIVEFKRGERSEPQEKVVIPPKRHNLVLDLRQR